MSTEMAVDLLEELRRSASIEMQTIVCLVRNGFDSNDAFIALDFDSDLPQIQDISDQQKSVLRQVLTHLSDKHFGNSSELKEEEKNSSEDINHLIDLMSNSSECNKTQILEKISHKLKNSFNEIKNGFNVLNPKHTNSELSFEQMNPQLDSSDDQLMANSSINRSANSLAFDSFTESSTKRRKSSLNSKQAKKSRLYECCTDQCLGHIYESLIEMQGHIHSTHFQPKANYLSNNAFERSPEFQPNVEINGLTEPQMNGSKDLMIKNRKSNLGFNQKELSSATTPKPVVNRNKRTYVCFTDDCNQEFTQLSIIQKHIQLIHFPKQLQN